VSWARKWRQKSRLILPAVISGDYICSSFQVWHELTQLVKRGECLDCSQRHSGPEQSAVISYWHGHALDHGLHFPKVALCPCPQLHDLLKVRF
jgi:hypothetical protein